MPKLCLDTIDRNDDSHRCTPESEVLHERFGSFCLIFALHTHQLPHVLGDFDSSAHIGLAKCAPAGIAVANSCKVPVQLQLIIHLYAKTGEAEKLGWISQLSLVQVRWQILLVGIDLVLQAPTGAAGATQVLQGSFRQGVQAGTRHHLKGLPFPHSKIIETNRNQLL